MVLNLVWVGFILIGFVVALVRLAQGDVAIFTKRADGAVRHAPRPASTSAWGWWAS
jgi:spore maturation protein SpmA